MLERRTWIALFALGLATVAHAGNPKDTTLPPWITKETPAVVPVSEPPKLTPPVMPKTPAILPSPTPPPTPAPLLELPSQLPSQLPGQLPTQLPGQLPTQLPGQLPTQLPGQLPTQFPGALPTELPKLPSVPSATAPTTTATATAVPAAVPAAPEAPAVLPIAPPVPTSNTAFQGFAMNERAYELVNMYIPTPAGSQRGLKGTLSLGGDSYTLWNYQVSGPYTLRGQASPFAPAHTGEMGAWAGARATPDVRVWQVYADIYPASAPVWHPAGQPYQPRRVGVLWCRILQKVDTNVYIMAPGPQTGIADGFVSFWNNRYRLLASGAFSSGAVAAPATAAPTAPNTEDLRNRQ